MKRNIALVMCIILTILMLPTDFLNVVYAEYEEYEGLIKAQDVINLDNLYGWASVSSDGVISTTGGGYVEPVIVSDRYSLIYYAGGNEPQVIIVNGSINVFGYLDIGSNKTIVGIDENATIIGEISIHNQSNVIISNLNVKGAWPVTMPEDGIDIENSHHIWVDHVNVWDAPDGNLDIKQGSDYITVSWSKFWYTDSSHEHRLSNLIGSGTGHDDTDYGKLNVTYHHCWFADNVGQRQPRLLYGKGHIYNNYYTSTKSSYCIGVGVYASALIENNYFNGVNNPHQFYETETYPATIVARGNAYNNTKGSKHSGYRTGQSEIRVADFDNPPYEYYLDDAEDIPKLVTNNAGPQNILEDGFISTDKPLITPAPVDNSDAQPITTKSPYLSDNPISYDEETDTYTYNGQNSDGSNGALNIANPFSGLDLSEKFKVNALKYPDYDNGVTLSYWVYIPSGGADVPVFNFNLYNSRQLSPKDEMAYVLTNEYDPNAKIYSLGNVSKYYTLDGTEVTVLSETGRYSKYSPLYPKEGAYVISPQGTVPAYEEGSDPTDSSQYVYLRYLGDGVYDTHSKKFDEEGGENSLLEEVLVNGSLSLYASGSIGYMRDNKTGQAINPNLNSYSYVTTIDSGSEFLYWGNGGTQTYRKGTKTPTMSKKGEWHFVVTVIQNDWITTYMDGTELTDKYLNYFGYSLSSSSNYYNYVNAKSFSFNRGYGPRIRYRTNTPDSLYTYTRSILDMITDEDTVLTIGGLGCSAKVFTQDDIKTGKGVQIKNIVAYPVVIEKECISKDSISSYVDGYAIKGDKLEVVKADLEATPSPIPSPEATLSPSPTITPSYTETAVPTPTESAKPAYSLGDVDMNGFVDAVDALMILKKAAMLVEFDEIQISLADMDSNKIIDATDALIVLKRAAKIN